MLRVGHRLRHAAARGSRRRCTKPESEQEMNELKEEMMNAVRLPLLPGAALGVVAGVLVPDDMPLANQLGLAAAAGAVGSIFGLGAGVMYVHRILKNPATAGGVSHIMVGAVTATGAVMCRKAVSQPVFAPLAEMESARTRQLEVRVDQLEARLAEQEEQLAVLRKLVDP